MRACLPHTHDHFTSNIPCTPPCAHTYPLHNNCRASDRIGAAIQSSRSCKHACQHACNPCPTSCNCPYGIFGHATLMRVTHKHVPATVLVLTLHVLVIRFCMQDCEVLKDSSSKQFGFKIGEQQHLVMMLLCPYIRLFLHTKATVQWSVYGWQAALSSPCMTVLPMESTAVLPPHKCHRGVCTADHAASPSPCLRHSTFTTLPRPFRSRC